MDWCCKWFYLVVAVVVNCMFVLEKKNSSYFCCWSSVGYPDTAVMYFLSPFQPHNQRGIFCKLLSKNSALCQVLFLLQQKWPSCSVFDSLAVVLLFLGIDLHKHYPLDLHYQHSHCLQFHWCLQYKSYSISYDYCQIVCFGCH